MYYIFKGNTENTNIEALVDDFCTFYMAGKDNKVFGLIRTYSWQDIRMVYVYIFMIDTL